MARLLHFLRAMATRLITCPETAHLEQIEYQIHPLGLLIEACTRFCPADRVDCPRTCAARLDRQRRDATVTKAEDETEPQLQVLEVRSLMRAR